MEFINKKTKKRIYFILNKFYLKIFQQKKNIIKNCIKKLEN